MLIMIYPNLDFERRWWKRGFRLVAGTDEVGRGCFAGPVVASAVAFAPISNYQFPITNEGGKKIIINDSKKMTARQRELADKWIRENVLCWGIGCASVTEINKVGIGKATKIAFRKAIQKANQMLDVRCKMSEKIDFLLIDAFYIPYTKGLRRKNQMAIIHGDAKSVSIAAASIVAKVYRDKLMQSLGREFKYKKYNWGQNKGYGTKEHREAIVKYGITRYHRKLFLRKMIHSL
jgi:ribonuclease HII